MNISLFSDWVEERRFGEAGLAGLIADIIDDAMAGAASGRVDEGLLHSAWETAKNEDAETQARTAVVLGRLGYERVVPALKEAESCGDPSVARAAAIVLAEMGEPDDKLLGVLVETLEDPAEARELRSAAGRAYAGTSTHAAIDRLIEIAASEDADLATYGIESLGYTRPEPDSDRRAAVLDALTVRLKSGDSLLASAAAESLGQFGDHDAVHDLEMILIEKDPSVRRRALFALARLGAESGKAPLIRMLGDFSIPARWEMVDLLGQCYGEEIAGSLARAAKDSDPEIRDHVVGALAMMDGPESLELLRRIADEDADEFVKEQATNALTERGVDIEPGAVAEEPEPEEPPVAAAAPAPPVKGGLAPPPPRTPYFAGSTLDAAGAPSGLTPRPPTPTAPLPPPAGLRPLFGPSAPVIPPAAAEAEPPERVVERSLEAMGASWRLEEQTYHAQIPLNGTTETAAILTGRVDRDGAPILQFTVICGPAQSGAFEAALRNNSDLIYGALAVTDIEGQPYFVLTDTILASAATTDTVRKTLIVLAQVARDLRG
jgi:HEAT repeat protein